MKKFEYRAVSIKKGTFASGEKYAVQLETELNALGADGWELIEITGSISLEGYLTFVLKRELASS